LYFSAKNRLDIISILDKIKPYIIDGKIDQNLANAIIDAADSNDLESIKIAYATSRNSSQNQNASTSQNQNAPTSQNQNAPTSEKIKIIKKLMFALGNVTGFKIADWFKKLSSNDPSYVNLQTFFNYMKTPQVNSNNKKPSDYIHELLNPSNYLMLKDPKTFVAISKISYDAILKYKNFIKSLDPNVSFYQDAKDREDELENSYKDLVNIGK
jgi:hypothetical protein